MASFTFFLDPTDTFPETIVIVRLSQKFCTFLVASNYGQNSQVNNYIDFQATEVLATGIKGERSMNTVLFHNNLREQIPKLPSHRSLRIKKALNNSENGA